MPEQLPQLVCLQVVCIYSYRSGVPQGDTCLYPIQLQRYICKSLQENVHRLIRGQLPVTVMIMVCPVEATYLRLIRTPTRLPKRPHSEQLS